MKGLWPLVAALGVAQIISWGTLFYAVGVVGPSMARDVGVSEVFVFGAFTAGLLVSGFASPLVGRAIDARGGRFVLALGSVLAAGAMAVLAFAWHPAVLVAGWLLAGAAMAAALYDPAFATLSQHAGTRYREAVAALTIFGGFASTVLWPLTHVLMEAWGWRATFGFYALVHLFVCLPLHRFLVPEVPPPQAGAEMPPAAGARPGLAWLTACFTLANFIASVVAVHLVNILVGAGLTPAQAISLGMLMGPAQVLGRILELRFSARVKVIPVAAAGFALLLVAYLTVLAIDGPGILPFVFIVTFGIGNGLFTIARGTVPAELYGRTGLGALLGQLARWALFARALAPVAFSGMLAVGFTRNAALASLAALAAASIGSFWAAVSTARSAKVLIR